jgi:hypothetical protein
MGNCTWCWKKSFLKLKTLMDDNSEFFNFPEEREEKYGRVGASYKKTGVPTKFFRGHRSVKDIRDMTRSTDDRFTDRWWNLAGACSESCDAFSSDDLFSVSGMKETRNGVVS